MTVLGASGQKKRRNSSFGKIILKVGTGKILSVRNSVVDPFTVQILSVTFVIIGLTTGLLLLTYS